MLFRSRVAVYTEAGSNTALEDDIDALDEARDIALARSAVYQQSLRNYHSRRVRDKYSTLIEGVWCTLFVSPDVKIIEHLQP